MKLFNGLMGLRVCYDANTGAQGGGASGGNAGASGASGGGGAAQGNAGAGNSAGNGTGSTGAGATNAGAPDWTQSLSEEHRGLVQTKGFKSADDVINSYKHIERAMGAPKDRVFIRPEKTDNKAEMDLFYKQLGRPDNAKDYAFENMPKEGVDQEFVDSIKSNFFDAGLTSSQANQVVQKYNEFLAKRQENLAAAAKDTEIKAAQGLQKEWGMAYEQNDGIAQEAMRALGVDKMAFEKFKTALGPAEAVKFFYNLGSKMGESSFVLGSGNKGGKNTPESARAEISRLQTDAGFQQLVQNGDRASLDKWANLHKEAYPDLHGHQ